MTCPLPRPRAPCRPIWRGSFRAHLSVAAGTGQATVPPHAENSWSVARKRAEEFARSFWTGGTLFEEWASIMSAPSMPQSRAPAADPAQCARCQDRPHPRPCGDAEGQGLCAAERAADKYHGVVKFDVVTGTQLKPKSNAPSYTRVFAESLIAEAGRDDKVVAITAAHALRYGTGPVRAGLYPQRTFDVGIAEQHAVTFAAAASRRRATSRSARSTPPSSSAPMTR